MWLVFSVVFDIVSFAGVAWTELHNRYKELMAKFSTMRAFSEA